MSYSSSRQPFNAWTRGMLSLASFLDKGVALPSTHPSPHSSISTLLIFQERELIAFTFTDSSPVANAVIF